MQHIKGENSISKQPPLWKKEKPPGDIKQESL